MQTQNPNALSSTSTQDNLTQHSNQMSRKELYEAIREQIRHEDGLVNQRLTWLLVSQAFTFALFGAILTNDNATFKHKTLVLCVVSVFGFAMNSLSFLSIVAAFRSLKRLREIWNHPQDYLKETAEGLNEILKRFPPITWVGRRYANAFSAAGGTPLLIIVIWGLTIIYVLQRQTEYGLSLFGVNYLVASWFLTGNAIVLMAIVFGLLVRLLIASE